MDTLTRLKALFVFLLFTTMTACGGGGGGSAGSSAPAAPAPTLNYDIKQLKFSWPAVTSATYYQLLENPDGASGFTQAGGNIYTTSVDLDIALHRRVNAQYMINACNEVGCTASSPLSLEANLLAATGYIKSFNSESADAFGFSVALSDDGLTLVVGAWGEASNADGINQNALDNTASDSGAVYVYTKEAAGWQQQAYIKASNSDAGDFFGSSLALSADGNTLAVGAFGEDSSTNVVINGDETDNSAINSGAAYVFKRTAGNWNQQAYLKPVSTDDDDAFGTSLSLSADGNTLAVGVRFDDSAGVGVVPDGILDNSGVDNGSVYIFTRDVNEDWYYQAYIKPLVTSNNDEFGNSVALSADGNTLAVGALRESSTATGINNDATDDSLTSSGAAYIFVRSGIDWTQQAYIKASNTGLSDLFGAALGLSADGNTLAVGARWEASNETGTSATGGNDLAAAAGAVYVYTRTATSWTQQAYIKSSNSRTSATFGTALALSSDGNQLAVGAPGENSTARGVAASQAASTENDIGAAYLFTRAAGLWTQMTYIKAPNADVDDLFGESIALSADGFTLAISAKDESSDADSIGGDQTDNSAVSAGAVYLY